MKKTERAQARMRGIIKAIKHDYCFIHGDDGVDRFAHAGMFDDVEFEKVYKHMRVEFTPVEAEKGPRAVDISCVR